MIGTTCGGGGGGDTASRTVTTVHVLAVGVLLGVSAMDMDGDDNIGHGLTLNRDEVTSIFIPSPTPLF